MENDTDKKNKEDNKEERFNLYTVIEDLLASDTLDRSKVITEKDRNNLYTVLGLVGETPEIEAEPTKKDITK